MPKSKKSDTDSSEYDSSDSDSGPDDKNPPPAAKKSKGEPQPSKTADKKSKSESAKDASTSGPWTLEGMRRVSISEFRGRKSVDIREFYEKGGEVLPGRKGISLSITQWLKLLEVAEEVTAAAKN